MTSVNGINKEYIESLKPETILTILNGGNLTPTMARELPDVMDKNRTFLREIRTALEYETGEREKDDDWKIYFKKFQDLKKIVVDLRRIPIEELGEKVKRWNAVLTLIGKEGIHLVPESVEETRMIYRCLDEYVINVEGSF